MKSIRQPNIGDLSGALKSARARFADIDLDAVQHTATAMARAAVPSAFAPPVRRRRRWPVAGAIIVLAVAILGILYMSPMIRRHEDSHDDLPEVDPTPMPGSQQADPRRPDLDAELVAQ